MIIEVALGDYTEITESTLFKNLFAAAIERLNTLEATV